MEQHIITIQQKNFLDKMSISTISSENGQEIFICVMLIALKNGKKPICPWVITLLYSFLFICFFTSLFDSYFRHVQYFGSFFMTVLFWFALFHAETYVYLQLGKHTCPHHPLTYKKYVTLSLIQRERTARIIILMEMCNMDM